MMKKFTNVFGKKHCPIIGMIHAPALPGTPNYDGNFQYCVERVRYEANLYKKHKIDAVMLENMHDLPYIQSRHFGPETVAAMSRLAMEMRQIIPDKTPCGIQVLASGNREALSIAKVCGLQFIRAEGFVFSHIADEGFTDACAGSLLRYRKSIQADDVLILADLKKKHSSHAITGDISLLETAQIAEFFLADGVIVTGVTTGDPANPEDLESLSRSKMKTPVLIGSGVTDDNLEVYFKKAHGMIIGSYFKRNGVWSNELDEQRISCLLDLVKVMRNDRK